MLHLTILCAPRATIASNCRVHQSTVPVLSSRCRNGPNSGPLVRCRQSRLFDGRLRVWLLRGAGSHSHRPETRPLQSSLRAQACKRVAGWVILGRGGTYAALIIWTVAAMTRPITTMNATTWRASPHFVFAPSSKTTMTRLFCHSPSRAIEAALGGTEGHLRVETPVKHPQARSPIETCKQHPLHHGENMHVIYLGFIGVGLRSVDIEAHPT
jgi:hypothetical protein